MTVLAAELVADDAGLAALAPDWDALWRRAPTATAFQSPAWMLAWWSAFGTGLPRVAVLRDEDGRLVGLLALYVLAAEGKILPMGAGLTDYQDALLAADAPPDATEVLLRTALWGVSLPCDLTDLAHGAALRGAAVPAGWRASLHEGDPCPVLTLGADLRSTIPAGQHRNVRQSRHRAEALGGWTHETATVSTRDDIADSLWRWHGARWGGPDHAVRSFRAAALPALWNAGPMRLAAIRIGGQLAAAFLILRRDGAAMLYAGGFDPAQAFASPGTLLFAAVIEAAIAEGLSELHFLRGREAYKYAWGAVDRVNVTRALRPG